MIKNIIFFSEKTKETKTQLNFLKLKTDLYLKMQTSHNLKVNLKCK